MKKSILYVGGMEFPDKNAAAQRVITNCKILNNIDFNIILAGISKEKKSTNSNYILEKYKINNYKLYSRPYPRNIKSWSNYMVNINGIINIVENSVEENIVAIVAYNYPSIALLRLNKYCEKKNIKLIADCTEWYGNKNIIKSIDTVFRMRYVQKKIRNIICISDYLENYYRKKDCLTVNIPSIVDIKDLKWKKAKKDQISKLKVFSYVGSPGVTKEKDRIDLILNAFHELKQNNFEFVFQIVGMTEVEFLKHFPNYKTVLLELNKNVVFFGKVPHAKAIEIVKKSDFAIFARKENRVTLAGFPTKLAESFACGTPVVTNPTSNISKFIQQGKSGYLAKDCSLKSLKEAIVLALNTDNQTLKKMREFCAEENPLDYRNYHEKLKEFTSKVMV